MSSRVKCTAFLLAALSACALPVSAQVPTVTAPAPVATDSAAWQRVLAYVVGWLDDEIVRASAGTGLEPWTIRVPEADPQAQQLASQLATILRARAVAPADTSYSVLELGPLRVSGDTARVDVRSEFHRRCPGSERTESTSWARRVFVPRGAGGIWGKAQSRVEEHGDSPKCPRT